MRPFVGHHDSRKLRAITLFPSKDSREWGRYVVNQPGRASARRTGPVPVRFQRPKPKAKLSDYLSAAPLFLSTKGNS